MRGPFSKELLLQSGMLQQQTECIAIIYKHLGVLMTPAHLYWLLGQIRIVVDPGQGHNRSMRALLQCPPNSSDRRTGRTNMWTVRFASFPVGPNCPMLFQILYILCILRVRQIEVRSYEMILLTGPNVLWSSTKFRGHCFSKGLLLQSWKATLTNGMYSSDLTAFGKKCCYFCFVLFWCLVFDMLWCCTVLDLVISTYFNHVNGAKCLIHINLCTESDLFPFLFSCI